MEQKNLQDHKKIEVWQPLLLSLMVVFGMVLGYKMNDKSERFLAKVNSDQDIQIGRVEEILRFIEDRYVDTVQKEVLISEAVNAMLSKLDPHSVYISPKDIVGINENMDGNFKGIGIESLYLEDTVIITTVVKDSPGAKAGLAQFDQILSINDSVVAGVRMGFDKIRDKLKNSGSTIKLEIKRRGSPNTLIKAVKLGEVPIHSADVAYMVKGNIGYIQIKQFSSNTYSEFMKNLEHLHEKEGMKNLIIDLRGNPGGYLPQATKILNQLFTHKDELLVFTEGKNQERQEYKTNGKIFFKDIDKIAVLVDEYSASGSEVIAGAIQDNDRGVIIGRKTFGKGLVQEQFDLSNGGALRLTTSRYYTPSGRSIQKPYSNQEEYDNEIYHRNIYSNTNKRPESAKPYKTLKKGRIVYSYSGIEPDIFIPGDSIQMDKAYHYLDYYTSEFLIKKYLSKKIDFKTKPDFNELGKEFIEFIASKEKSDIKLKYLPKAKQKLEEQYEYIKTNGDDDAKSKLIGINDPFIKAAVSHMENKQ